MGQLYPNPISTTAGITIIAGTGLSGGGSAVLGGSIPIAATGGLAATRAAYTTTPATDGITQNFDIVGFPLGLDLSYADVFVNGVLQTLNVQYAISGSLLLFTYAPAAGDIIDVVFSSPVGSRFQYQLSPAPNGATTSFSFPTDTPTSLYVDIYNNGILQTPGFSYNLNLTAGVWAVVFTTAPLTGDILEAVFAPADGPNSRNLYGLTPIANGSTTSFTISPAMGPWVGYLTNINLYADVYINGIYQTISTNYNLNLVGGVWTIVFTTAPKTGDILEVVF
jgi:hypothetical protein